MINFKTQIWVGHRLTGYGTRRLGENYRRRSSCNRGGTVDVGTPVYTRTYVSRDLGLSFRNQHLHRTHRLNLHRVPWSEGTSSSLHRLTQGRGPTRTTTGYPRVWSLSPRLVNLEPTVTPSQLRHSNHSRPIPTLQGTT